MTRWRSLRDYKINYDAAGYYIAESFSEKNILLLPPPIYPYKLVLKAADVVLQENQDVRFTTDDYFWYMPPAQPDKDDNNKVVITGKNLVVTTNNNASKGHIELTNVGSLWELFIPSTMVVGGENDTECEIKIY